MTALYIVLGIIGAALLWIIVDIVIAILRKPIPDLPKEFLDPLGLSKIYHYLTEPDKVPEGLVINEKFILDCIEPSIKYINNRYDCADFRLQLLFRLYKDCGEKLPSSVKELIKKTSLDFKYWMDEKGSDSMCYWSENHQLLFAVSEYLHGQEWPKETFTNSGMRGAEHMDKAIKRIYYWMEQRFRYGFSEWFSNNYYAEDIAPMSNYIEYSRHKDSVLKMKIIFDILWYDIATHSVNNTFVGVSSRMYGDNKSSDMYGNRIRAAMDTVWGMADTSELVNARSSIEKKIAGGDTDIETTVKLVGVDAQMMQNFIAMYRKGFYKVPDLIREIGEDSEPAVVKASEGLNPDELSREGLIGQDDRQIMAQLGSETFTNPEAIENTLRYLSRVKMFRNKFVNPFSFINIKLLRLLSIPKLISSKCELMTNGIALGRGNVYCYKNKHYALTTAVKQNVDSCGAQAHIWTANLAPDLCLYTTHPARDDDSRDKHGASPGYWVGNGRQPMSVQDENVNITIYKIPTKKRLLEFRLSDVTHAFVPKEKYDILEFEGDIMFGRKGSVLVAMITNGEVNYRPYDEYAASLLIQHDKLVDKIKEINLRNEFDLVRHGGEYHTYITELSDTDTETYEDFKKRIKGNKAVTDGGRVIYNTGGKEIEVSYEKTFRINGQDINTEYKRYESRYSETERFPEKITIEYKGKKLVLDYSKGERKEYA